MHAESQDRHISQEKSGRVLPDKNRKDNAGPFRLTSYLSGKETKRKRNSFVYIHFLLPPPPFHLVLCLAVSVSICSCERRRVSRKDSTSLETSLCFCPHGLHEYLKFQSTYIGMRMGYLSLDICVSCISSSNGEMEALLLSSISGVFTTVSLPSGQERIF